MIAYDGLSDIGLEREEQEDIIFQTKIDANTLLFVIADGVGLVNEAMNPSVIACMEVSQYLQRQYNYNKQYFFTHLEQHLTESFLTANRVLGAFHLIDDEKYKSFGCCMTACVIYDNNSKCSFAHCGNTRLHLIKTNKNNEPVIRQLTIDHTKGFEQLVQQKITEEEYLQGLDKMQLTSSLGVFADPMIQTSTVKFNVNNIIVMTTDGVHYPLWQHVILELTLRAANTQSACKALIEAAKMRKYPDNMAAMTIFNMKDP